MRCCTLVGCWHSTDIAGIMSLLPPDYQAEALVEGLSEESRLSAGGRETQAAKGKANAAKAETVERLWRMLPPSQRARGIAASAVLERACKVVVGEDAKRAAEGGGEGGMEEGGVGRGGEAGGQGACSEKPKTESGILVLKAQEAERVGEGVEELSREVREEYRVRRQMVLTRAMATLHCFEAGGRGEGKGGGKGRRREGVKEGGFRKMLEEIADAQGENGTLYGMQDIVCLEEGAAWAMLSSGAPGRGGLRSFKMTGPVVDRGGRPGEVGTMNEDWGGGKWGVGQKRGWSGGQGGMAAKRARGTLGGGGVGGGGRWGNNSGGNQKQHGHGHGHVQKQQGQKRGRDDGHGGGGGRGGRGSKGGPTTNVASKHQRRQARWH